MPLRFRTFINEDVDPNKYVSQGARKTVGFNKRIRDLSPEDQKAARKSADRKTARDKSKAPKGSRAAHNVIADAGRRYRVGDRPVHPTDPKHKQLRINKAIAADMDRARARQRGNRSVTDDVDHNMVDASVSFMNERHLVRHGDGNYVTTADGEKVLTVGPNKKDAKRFSKSMAKRIANQPITRLVGGKHVPIKKASGEVVRAEEVEPIEEMSAKQHYAKFKRGGRGKGFVVSSPIDRDRYPNRERQGLEGPYKSRKSGKIFYYDKRAGKYYDPDSDMYLQVNDVMEAKEKIKVKLDPKKKIGYTIHNVGPGGKKTLVKRRDMPGKKDVG